MELPTQYQYLYGKPQVTAKIRQQPEDFQVTEIPSFEPEGDGEHVFLYIRKVGENTDWVAKQLANFCQVPVKDVGYAGKKDRHAVTEQWFSVRVPLTRVVTWSLFETESIKVLKAVRHPRKLRLGSLAGNRFTLRLRDVSDAEAFKARLEKIVDGVPNYFGEQRFGFEGGNLHKGLALLSGELKEHQRHKKGLYISAVRSWVFNHVLSQRITEGLWAKVVTGDVMMLAGTQSIFSATDPELTELQNRLDSFDIHLTGPLWGRGASGAADESLLFEQRTLDPWESVCERLEHVGLRQERRALRLVPKHLSFEQETSDSWLVSFELPAGAFATSVLRELCVVGQESN